jgi:hypothetical protein
MLVGRFSKDRPNWVKYQTLKFEPHLQFARKKPRLFQSYIKKGHYAPNGTCGTYTFSTLTGISPAVADKLLRPGVDEWTDRKMLYELRKRGFQVTPLTRSFVTHQKDFAWYPIKTTHVILLSQYSLRNEGTWAIAHRGRYFHNLKIEPFTPYELINNPMWSAYLVFHPRWETDSRACRLYRHGLRVRDIPKCIREGVPLDWERRYQLGERLLSRKQMIFMAFDPIFGAEMDDEKVPKMDPEEINKFRDKLFRNIRQGMRKSLVKKK